MPLLTPQERTFVAAITELTFGNPFLPSRIESEQKALGKDFVEVATVWHRGNPDSREHPNVNRIGERVEALALDLGCRLETGKSLSEAEAPAYRDLVLYLLYNRHHEKLFQLIGNSRAHSKPVSFYPQFVRDAEQLFAPSGGLRDLHLPHLFACFFQIRRAFHHLFHFILGGSLPAAELRAAVWQSIFTHDMRRYRRLLYDRMGEITTLITGPSGTGKELVARAIGLSRYIPFDPTTQTFSEDPETSFFPLNLSALSPTVIESELFGHARGAFTGAAGDKAGWLEVCPPLGTVFLDEIGEVEPAIQVKLLRVLQSRQFERLGETRPRHFRGKIIAATNRDLGVQIGQGEFREDLFYRLCSDLITTPSLAEQLDGSAEQLHTLLLLLAGRFLRQDEDARALAEEVMDWIEHGDGSSPPLGINYPWPGNVRELEQCLRNVLIRRRYQPPAKSPTKGMERLREGIEKADLSAAEVLSHYTTWVYHKTGSYQATARQLGIDRRTAKAKVDPELLAHLRDQS